MSDKKSAIEVLRDLLGITDVQAKTIMPNGDHGAGGFPGALISYDDDNSSWAAKEYAAEMKRYKDRPI